MIYLHGQQKCSEGKLRCPSHNNRMRPAKHQSPYIARQNLSPEVSCGTILVKPCDGRELRYWLTNELIQSKKPSSATTSRTPTCDMTGSTISFSHTTTKTAPQQLRVTKGTGGGPTQHASDASANFKQTAYYKEQSTDQTKTVRVNRPP